MSHSSENTPPLASSTAWVPRKLWEVLRASTAKDRKMKRNRFLNSQIFGPGSFEFISADGSQPWSFKFHFRSFDITIMQAQTHHVIEWCQYDVIITLDMYREWFADVGVAYAVVDLRLWSIHCCILGKGFCWLLDMRFVSFFWGGGGH